MHSKYQEAKEALTVISMHLLLGWINNENITVLSFLSPFNTRWAWGGSSLRTSEALWVSQTSGKSSQCNSHFHYPGSCVSLFYLLCAPNHLAEWNAHLCYAKSMHVFTVPYTYSYPLVIYQAFQQPMRPLSTFPFITISPISKFLGTWFFCLNIIL